LTIVITAMEIPHFIRLLIKSPLVVSTIRAKSISDIDVSDAVCVRMDGNSLELTNFELSCEEYFKSVSIVITRYGTMIDLISPDPKYFEQSAYYFNVCKAGRKIRVPYRKGRKIYQAKSKRIGNFELFDGFLQGTVLRSDLFGCKIMFSYNKLNSLF